MSAPISSTPYLSSDARLVQGDGRVQRGLPAQGGQQRVGALAGDHLLQHVRGDRLDVGGVGELRVGHDRRRVGVDQADPEPSGAQHPAGLGAGVVELAGLPDDDRPGADDQDRLAGRRASAWRSARRRSIRSPNWSNRSAASCGPGAASGWYCTENAGRVQQPQALDHAVVEVDVADLRRGRTRCRSGCPGPSPGSADREAVVVAGDLDPAGGAGPCTGWLTPRWPNRSL